MTKLGELLKQSVYSLYELIYILWYKVNDIIDSINNLDSKSNQLDSTKVSIIDLEVNRKVGKTGNFTGTWHGLMPSQTEPGLSSLVGKHDNQLTDIVTYNVKNHILYDNMRLDIAINDIMNNIQAGETLFVPKGDYTIGQTLNFSNIPSGCIIDIRGTLHATAGIGTAINLGGGEFTFKLNKLTTDRVPLADYSNMIDDGIFFGKRNLYNAEIKINIVEGFNKALKFTPDYYESERQFIQYCKIDFNSVRNSSYCIYFDVTNNISWVNENTFYGGRLSGKYGITFKNGANADVGYNNNKFYNVGFEGITSDAITLENAYGNSFVNCRMMESITGVYIKDIHVNNKQNLYIFSHLIPIDRIDITSKLTRVIAPMSLTSTGAWDFAGFVVNPSSIRVYDIVNKVYKGITGSYIMPPNYSTNLINSNAGGSVEITLPKEANVEGCEITFKVGDYLNPITILNYDGTTALPSGRINSVGMWTIYRINGVWYEIKI